MGNRFSGKFTLGGRNFKCVWLDGERVFIDTDTNEPLTPEQLAMIVTKPAPPVSREQTERFIQELYGD